MHKLSTSYPQGDANFFKPSSSRLSKIGIELFVGIKVLIVTVFLVSLGTNLTILASTTSQTSSYSTSSAKDVYDPLDYFLERRSNQLEIDKTSKDWDKDFEAEVVLADEELFKLPIHLDSAFAIQNYLEKKGSFLANYLVSIDFVGDEGVLEKYNNPNFSSQPDLVLKPYLGEKMLFSELVWRLSQESLGSGCSLIDHTVCFDNAEEPINPAFLLAMVQKESGLIYGKNSKLNPNEDKTQFLLDRITGYYCIEIKDNKEKEQSCFDENPKWKYYKGVFRQLYYTMRFTRLMMKRCESQNKANRGLGNTYYVGNKIKVDNQEITLKGTFACASYIYTPHVSAQKLFFKVYQEILNEGKTKK